MAHRVDRVRLVIVSSETKPLPTTPVIETLPRYELYIWSMQARDNNKTCAVLMNLAVHEAFVLLAGPKEQNNLGFRNIG